MDVGSILIKRVRLFIILFLVLAMVFVGLLIRRSLTFRLVGTNPSTDAVATISPFIKIDFNKPLAPTIRAVIKPQNLAPSYEIQGSTIVVTFHKQLQEGATYVIYLSNIRDNQGNTLPDKTINFQAKNIAAGDLPADQQLALKTNEAQYDAIQGDGLVKLLPFTGGGNEFTVSYTINYTQQQPHLIIVVTVSSPQAQADALNWIKQVGFDPSKYIITFSSPAGNE